MLGVDLQLELHVRHGLFRTCHTSVSPQQANRDRTPRSNTGRDQHMRCLVDEMKHAGFCCVGILSNDQTFADASRGAGYLVKSLRDLDRWMEDTRTVEETPQQWIKRRD